MQTKEARVEYKSACFKHTDDYESEMGRSQRALSILTIPRVESGKGTSQHALTIRTFTRVVSGKGTRQHALSILTFTRVKWVQVI